MNQAQKEKSGFASKIFGNFLKLFTSASTIIIINKYKNTNYAKKMLLKRICIFVKKQIRGILWKLIEKK